MKGLWSARSVAAALAAALCRGVAWSADYSAGDGIVVLEPPAFDAARLAPSPAFAVALKRQGDVPPSWSLKPAWSTVSGPYETVKELNSGGPAPARYRAAFDGLGREADLYGTGEQAGPLRRNGCVTFVYCKDNYTYGGGPNLYQAHPWVLGVRKDGRAFGVVADTTARGEIDLRGGNVRFDFEAAPFRVVVIERESPQGVLAALASLTGTMELPPKWALGYQQCRYSYMDDAEIRSIAENFRSRRLPCDVIWFDIHYMDGFRIFTVDKARFPDPKATNAYLHERGFRSVWMIDPAPKADPDYAVFREMRDRGFYVRTGDGPQLLSEEDAKGRAQLASVPDDMYVGRVWPGLTGFPDFTLPAAAAWWGGLYQAFLAMGVDGVWNDMNEPAVFNGGPQLTMPDCAAHLGGVAFAGGVLQPGRHALYHNIYGMLMIKASREGILLASPDRRPFVLSRSNYLGGHRYGATWTGDNAASEAHMKLATPMCLNMGLSGQPFVGPDLGGYAGSATPELFARWIGVGAFYPFMRGHSELNAPRKEPWAFGEETERAARVALSRRYRLMPYLYTQFQKASTSGLPVMQPAFFADVKDPALRAEENAFLCGTDLLVVPDWHGGALPKGAWRALSVVEGDDGKYQPALRIRPGAIVPAGPPMQHTDEQPLDPLTLYVSLDEKGEAAGALYEDAGNGFGYRSGEYRLTTYAARLGADGKPALSVTAAEGRQMKAARSVRVVWVKADRQVEWLDWKEAE
jgi:alpha-glucosidase